MTTPEQTKALHDFRARIAYTHGKLDTATANAASTAAFMHNRLLDILKDSQTILCDSRRHHLTLCEKALDNLRDEIAVMDAVMIELEALTR